LVRLESAGSVALPDAISLRHAQRDDRVHPRRTSSRTTLATKRPAASVNDTPPNTNGSSGLTPYSSPYMARVMTIDATSPQT
jgi:hypothetical protein